MDCQRREDGRVGVEQTNTQRQRGGQINAEQAGCQHCDGERVDAKQAGVLWPLLGVIREFYHFQHESYRGKKLHFYHLEL